MILRNSIFICFLLVFGYPNIDIHAKHIIGGDMYYECVLSDTSRKLVNFRVTMKLYRDCSNPEGALFDTDAKFGIYEKMSDGRFRFIKDISNINYLRPIVVIDPKANNPCLIVPRGVCVEEGTYQFVTGNLSMLSSGSYYISYQRCCRNETISNIIRPGEAGAALTLEITAEAQRLCNNSPLFKSFPPVVVCVNNPIEYDHSATDKEGDLVTYEFCTPLIAGGQDGTPGGRNSCFGVTPDPSSCLPPYLPVTFKAPLYSTIYPMAGNPLVTIDPITGIISGTPEVQGQYVVGVCIKEFRNGILLTETRRDFQFNVTYCEPKVFAKVQADSVMASGETYVLNSCGAFDVDFENRSTDVQFISSYLWEFDIQGLIQSDNNRNARFNFPQIGTYRGKMFVNKGTLCSDSLNILVNIFPEIHADYSYQYDTCVAGPIEFTDLSYSGSNNLISWNWNFSGEGSMSLQNPEFTFPTPGRKQIRLQVKDINGCLADTTLTIPYYPVPPLLIIDPDQTDGCSPLNVCLTNLSVPIDTSYTVIWDFGDGTSGKGLSPCHRYEAGGTYSLKLEVTSPIGCYTERNYNQLINVRQSPDAQFEINPDKINIFNPRVSITDQSTFATSRNWEINNSDRLTQAFFQYTFRDTGIQKIQLIANNINGCKDTLIKYIDVVPIVTYYLPNAFTPNGDANNDEFVGVGYTYGLSDFDLSVWDRWGSRVFQTNDPLVGWNGRKDNAGENLPNGVYVYTLKYKTPRGEPIENKGFATLIR
ncbi:MAG: gliding motility-associated C-terminal domain-containing protein [Saprospiraceae bacterium]|nr:gliding motility-associated C-terminal domain-containing protein [Saprospiraceae bacterium]